MTKKVRTKIKFELEQVLDYVPYYTGMPEDALCDYEKENAAENILFAIENGGGKLSVDVEVFDAL